MLLVATCKERQKRSLNISFHSTCALYKHTPKTYSQCSSVTVGWFSTILGRSFCNVFPSVTAWLGTTLNCFTARACSFSRFPSDICLFDSLYCPPSNLRFLPSTLFTIPVAHSLRLFCFFCAKHFLATFGRFTSLSRWAKCVTFGDRPLRICHVMWSIQTSRPSTLRHWRQALF